ncbi:glycosyltransferase involved in cell wall biosynthesis [Acholeplasma morum]|uniref:glycosyltransferase n=1 Tax=Paracholeplasma morum TaxID=264637 RepID=UPI00195E112E|nr:glycosyltransferase [Paracholeplasma morum]MBM7453015.1 glycosyltransferase involved in cell wall biosynthesis [Paracholeplasma morum]
MEQFNRVRSQALNIFALFYLLMMFVIWNINYLEILLNNTNIYTTANMVLAGLFILNIDLIFKEKRFKTVLIYVVVILLLVFNSFFIVYGERSRSYIFSLIPLFMLYQIIYQRNTKKYLDIVLHSLLGLFSFYNVVGIIGFLFKLDTFFLGIPNFLTDNYRYSSILTNPNAWGIFAFIGLWISVYYLLKSRNIYKEILYGGLVALAFGAIILSMSRVVLVMTIILYVGLIITSKLYEKRIRMLLYASAILILLGIIGLMIYDIDFMINLFRLNQGLTDREEIWNYMIGLIQENFFFGIGYGNSTMVLSLSEQLIVTSSHNMYLGLLLEMGFLPLLVLLGYFCYHIYRLIRTIKYTNVYRIELIFVVLFLIGFLVGQFFEFSYFKVDSVNTFIFFLFGLSIEITRQVRKEGIYKRKITHLITGLDNGGAESMLYKIIKNRDQSKFTYQVISLDSKGFYGPLIEKEGVKVVALNMRGIKKSILGLFSLGYHLVGTNTLQTWLYHANLIGVIMGRLLLVDSIIWGVRQADISMEHNKASTVRIARISKYFGFLTDQILSCSDETTLTHKKLGYQDKKFVTIYNGFELDKFKYEPSHRDEMRKSLGLSNELTFINVARFDIQKDHETLFKSMSLLKKEGVSFKLLLCGIDIRPENETLTKMIQDNDLVDNVILLGVRNDVNRLLVASDYFLLSSLGEGFPNVLGEAMASKRIPITTDAGDCKMIVGDCGKVVERRNPEAFKNAIKEILSLTVKEKEALENKSRIRIEQHFDIKSITRSYEALY